MSIEPTLIRGSYTVKINGKEIQRDYAYVACESTLKDEQLIAWSERREAELRAKRG